MTVEGFKVQISSDADSAWSVLTVDSVDHVSNGLYE